MGTKRGMGQWQWLLWVAMGTLIGHHNRVTTVVHLFLDPAGFLTAFVVAARMLTVFDLFLAILAPAETVFEGIET